MDATFLITAENARTPHTHEIMIHLFEGNYEAYWLRNLAKSIIKQDEERRRNVSLFGSLRFWFGE